MRFSNDRTILRLFLAGFYIAAGCVHLYAPEAHLLIAPSWVPFPYEVIVVTGLFEMSVPLGLFHQSLRAATGWSLALYAALVFPANLFHALYHICVSALRSTWFYRGPSLALQPVLVWAALYAGEIIDWPCEHKLILASGATSPSQISQTFQRSGATL